jgi:hypothetical protein
LPIRRRCNRSGYVRPCSLVTNGIDVMMHAVAPRSRKRRKFARSSETVSTRSISRGPWLAPAGLVAKATAEQKERSMEILRLIAVAAALLVSACSKSAPDTSSASEQAQAVQSALALPPDAASTLTKPPIEPPTTTTMTARTTPSPASVGVDASIVRVLGVPPTLTSTSMPLHAGAAPHLFHLGASSFFLDHEELALTSEQRSTLSGIRERAVLGYATTQRKIDQAEQDLWSLTSAEHPLASRVEAKLAEIARLWTQQRMDYIRTIGDAVAQLTDAQHKVLAMAPTGTGGAASTSTAGSGATAPPMPMPTDTAAPSAGGSGMPGMPMEDKSPMNPMGASDAVMPGMGHM